MAACLFPMKIDGFVNCCRLDDQDSRLSSSDTQVVKCMQFKEFIDYKNYVHAKAIKIINIISMAKPKGLETNTFVVRLRENKLEYTRA